MTSQKHDFYGKEVTDAIQQACEKLQVPQEQLDIEVVETGSTGIFGLIRKKAHIRACVRKEEEPQERRQTMRQFDPAEDSQRSQEAAADPAEEAAVKREAAAVQGGGVPQEAPPSPDARTRKHVVFDQEEEAVLDDEDELADDAMEDGETGEELPEAVLLLVKEELLTLLNLMGYPSTVEVSAKGNSVLCHIDRQYQDVLAGQEGKTLDSLQYLLRKIIARKIPDRLRLILDVGDYREKRLDELKAKALELAEKVKVDGKTQVIAALSPSERRVIHMSLQDDKEIRSRSVGEGLFKKILIYKPGKGGRTTPRKRGNSRGRRGAGGRKKGE